MFFNFDHPLGTNADMYLDFRAAWADTAERYVPSVGTFSFTPSESLKQRLRQDPEIDSLPARSMSPIDSSATTIVIGGRTRMNTTSPWVSAAASSTGNYNTYVRYYRHDAVEIGDTFVSATLAQQAIEEGNYDIENPYSTNPVHLAAIRDTGLRLTRDQVTDHKTARVSFDGQAFTLVEAT